MTLNTISIQFIYKEEIDAIFPLSTGKGKNTKLIISTSQKKRRPCSSFCDKHSSSIVLW